MNTLCRDNPHEFGKALDLTLAIAPNANHCKRNRDTKKPAPAFLPIQALHWLDSLRQSGRRITGIHLCGPGDVLASWSSAAAFLDMLQGTTCPLSITCLGLGGAEHTADLLNHKVSRVTLLVDTLQRETAEKLYSWIRPGKKTLPLAEGVAMLLDEQSLAVQTMVSAGLNVGIRTVIHQGINHTEISGIAKTMANLGAKSMEIVGDERFVQAASPYLNAQTAPCEKPLSPSADIPSCSRQNMPHPSTVRPNLAVASSNGMDVNLHLGQAQKLLIYGPRDDGLTCLLETRRAPGNGVVDRWQVLAGILPDCFAVLASHAGETPRTELAQSGIELLLLDDQIEGVVDTLYGGGKKKKCRGQTVTP